MNNFKMMVITLTAAFCLSFTTVSLANKSTSENNKAELQFVGKDKSLPLFRLILNSDNPAVYEVNVMEENGTVLLTEKLEGKNISRTYKLNTDDYTMVNGTTFEVTNKQTNITEVYKVSSLSLSYTTVTAAKKVVAEKISAELQFEAYDNNLPVYRLVINNKEQAAYTVSISEDNGNLLYTEILKGKNISKLYKLDVHNADLINGTTFDVTDKATRVTTSYKVADIPKTGMNASVSKL